MGSEHDETLLSRLVSMATSGVQRRVPGGDNQSDHCHNKNDQGGNWTRTGEHWKARLEDKKALLYESSVVERFVPKMLLESLKKKTSERRKAKFSRYHGIVGFFDVSGYSKLSSELERVYSQRKRGANFSTALSDQFSNTRPLAGLGAEELADQLNNTLGELVDLILSSGGDVVKFAGDAILAFWEADKGN